MDLYIETYADSRAVRSCAKHLAIYQEKQHFSEEVKVDSLNEMLLRVSTNINASRRQEAIVNQHEIAGGAQGTTTPGWVNHRLGATYSFL